LGNGLQQKTETNIFSHGTTLRSAFQGHTLVTPPSGKRPQYLHWAAEKADPRTKLEVVAKSKKFEPIGTSAVQLVTVHDIPTFKLLNIHKN